MHFNANISERQQRQTWLYGLRFLCLSHKGRIILKKSNLISFDKIFEDNEMRLCRICVTEIDGDAVKLFSEKKESEDIIMKIFLCSQVTIEEKNSFINYICSNCLTDLNMAFHFRLKCCNSEQNIKNFLERNQIDIDDYKHEAKAEPCSPKDTASDEDTKDRKTLTENVNKELIKICIKCDICKKLLKTKASLTRHKVTMHQNRRHVGDVTGFGLNRLYHCSKCDYSSPHSQTLVNHIRKHTGERPYQCHCGKKFTQSSALTAHKKIHSNHTFFTCSICGKQFKHAFSLKKHSKVHEEGTYICVICKKILKSKETLQDHMYRHNNVRNYNCEECGNTFVTSSELSNHRKKHNTEKKIECHLCGYKTNTKKLLILHIKRHTGDKAYKCEKCEVSFITTAELRVHKRVHTHEKPYACPTCSQRFMHSPSVNKHMRNVHGIKYKWGELKHTFMNQTK